MSKGKKLIFDLHTITNQLLYSRTIMATASFLENLHLATHLGSLTYFVGQGNLATNKQAAQPKMYMKISTKIMATISTPVILVKASEATPSQKTDHTRHKRAKLLRIENFNLAAKYFTRTGKM